MKTSGQLQVVNVPYNEELMDNNNLIRVIYRPELDGVKEEIILGTYYFNAELQQQVDGNYQGVITLKSALYRWKDDIVYDEIKQDYQAQGGKGHIIKHGSALDEYLQEIVGQDFYYQTLNKYVFENDHILTRNLKVLEMIQWICDDFNMYYTVDEYGKLVIKPYKQPKERIKSGYKKITANGSSVVDGTVKVYSSLNDAPNVVIFQYDLHQDNGAYTSLYSKSYLVDKEPRSVKNLNRRIVDYNKITDIALPETATIAQKKQIIFDKLNKMSKRRLQELNEHNTYIEFSCYYQPLKVNDIVLFEFGNIKVYGYITDITLTVGVGAKMKVKMRKIREA